MEGSNRVFVDSSCLVAFFNTGDVLHQRAVGLMKALEAPDVLFVISSFIFLEVVTVLAQRAGKNTAVRAGTYLLEDPKTEVIHIDPELQEEAWQIFREVKSKNVSFVDCSVIAVMTAERISELVTFDVSDFEALKKIYHFRFFRSA